MSGEARPPFGKAPATPGNGAPAGPAGSDPSMEDILASIRRILNEEDAAPAPAGSPSAEEPAEDEDEPLTLSEDMLVREPPAPLAQPPEAPAPVAMAPEPPAPAPPVIPEPVRAPEQALAGEGLLAPAAAAAATASLGTLLKTVAQERTAAVSRNGPTIEDVVREAIRPMLKEWLDEHLPPLVERLVRAEIERVVGRALS